METAAALHSAGILVPVLTVGSTEMRPDTYVFGDANQVTLGSQRLEDCALAVSRPFPSRPEAGGAKMPDPWPTHWSDVRENWLMLAGCSRRTSGS